MSSWFGSIIPWIVQVLGGVMPVGARASMEGNSREIGYRYRELFYSNALYLNRARGGMLEDVVANDLCKLDCDSQRMVMGLVGSVKEIVDLYAAIFPGTWGDGMGIKATVGNQPVNKGLVDNDPLGRMWRWSSLDTEKQKLLQWGANLGKYGIRIYGRDDVDAINKRVYLKVEHPGRIFDYRLDDRGNATDVMLKYKMLDPNVPLGDTRPDQVEVIETISKDGFSKTYDGKEQLTAKERENTLGVCPFVIGEHAPGGMWAYAGSEPIIHAANYLAGLIFTVTDQNANANYYGTGGGDAPETMPLPNGRNFIYVKLAPDMPEPSFQAIVSPIDYTGVLAVVERMMKNLRSRQPELNFNNIDTTATISGEALQQFIKPTEKKIIDARPNYDHALKRAMQIGLSYMVGMDLADFGTGTGTAQAADKAYQSGAMDFDFIDRPALPQTVAQQLLQIQLDDAAKASKLELATVAKGIGLDNDTVLKEAGYDPKTSSIVATPVSASLTAPDRISQLAARITKVQAK